MSRLPLEAGRLAITSITTSSSALPAPRIIPRPLHNISRRAISAYALKVLYHLSQHGYQAYLVGGGVRDLLLDRTPKDFDVATDARPEQVRALFKNCRLIGRRFRLAHVHFGAHIIEVATFRAAHTEESAIDDSGRLVDDESGRILRDNQYGTLEEDAVRRDFTVNALYYNIADFSVVDFMNGMDDLKSRVLRLIGEPEQRYREDPVRMLRALRFAAKLDFDLDPATEAPLRRLHGLLADIPPARLFEEVVKLLMTGHAAASWRRLAAYPLCAALFGDLSDCLTQDTEGRWQAFIERALANTDARLAVGKPVTPLFLFAALLWPRVSRVAYALEQQGSPPLLAMMQAGDEAVARQLATVAIPKRFSLTMREIWQLQWRLTQRGGKRPLRLVTHPRFRAAYDFLLLRAEVGDAPMELAAWWTEFQVLDEAAREVKLQAEPPAPKRRRRKRAAPRKATSPAPGE